MPAGKKGLYLYCQISNMIREEQVKMIAETLLPGFTPKDPEVKELSFHFTVPPGQSFKVHFKKEKDTEWKWLGYEKADPEA